jgi:integrase
LEHSALSLRTFGNNLRWICADNLWLYPLFVTMIYTGLRLGELIALIRDELDWHGKFIEVRQALSRDANSLS